ncbi:hypothetical protein Tlie_1787 [Thermovirga lienii DSM 17291]|uniref:Uncharacterized protein n=1 Tax=Thermovirga lienii (strain ATCC BAA-1197 / DSM 17291 / Cas60314) TaxID=580340 RepID=G7V8X2_THELD|nr:hypothetical protein [Thermovirga lienii]AER67506.1 hypothetical protein Tlie_1787 [Thermovirga lienii DSM 17291]
MRNITDILFFRGDISPFLVHLTRDHEEMEAKEVLKEILDKRKLVAGRDSIRVKSKFVCKFPLADKITPF